MSLGLAVLDFYVARKGMRETSRNRGDEIDKYHEFVGLDPKGEYAWCTDMAAFACAMEAKRLGLPNPFPKTAKAVRVFELLHAICGESNPAPGYFYVLAHGKAWKNERYTDAGHLGIVRRATAEVGDIDELSGNTNAKGSREGNCVEEHHGEPEVTHGGTLLGYLNIDKAVAQMGTLAARYT